jgi:1-acyl-sn-glycerol-3-phosphate acyltransferase
MRDLLRAARSLLSVVLVGVLFLLGSLVLRLVVLPGAWLFPRSRFLLVSVFMRAMARGILGLLTLGGARLRRIGRVDTRSPVVIVGNHQALLEILQIALLADPRVPAFVTRRRYRRFIPLVSASIRLLGCPIVDPKRDPTGAIEAIRRGANELPHGLMIFPEGHRSRDGQILPFRPAGLETILRARPVPVYLALTDGLWRVRRFADLLFRVHRIDAVTEIIGPIPPPSDPGAIGAFALELRERLVARLAERRREAKETLEVRSGDP